MGRLAEKLAAKGAAFERAYLGSLASNQAKSGQFDKYCQTLTNFEFLAAKINHPDFGVTALIGDYNWVEVPEVSHHPDHHPQKVKALQLIQGALLLSAHILAEDKPQLMPQLWGRLGYFELPEIQALLEGAKQQQTAPWLRLLTPSLTLPGGRLIRTFTGHTESVNAVAVTPDRKLLISGSDDHTIKVWNLKTGALKFTLTGHRGSVNTVAVTPDGRRVISGSSDRNIKVWNLETGVEESTRSIGSSVIALAQTWQGALISASSDGMITVWDWTTGAAEKLYLAEELYPLRDIRDGTSYRRKSNSVLAVTPEKVVLGYQYYGIGNYNRLDLADLPGLQWTDQFGTDDSCFVTSVAVIDNDHFDFKHEWYLYLSRNRKRIRNKFEYYLFVYGSSNGTISLCGRKIEVLTQNKKIDLVEGLISTIQRKMKGHKSSVTALVSTYGGERLISGSSDGTIKVWNLETRALEFNLTGHSNSITAVTVITPYGERVISGSLDGTIKIWNIEKRRGLFSFTDNLISRKPILTIEGEGHKSAVKAIAVTPDGKRVISGSRDKTLKVWNLETGVEEFTLTGHKRSVNAVAITPDGKQVVSGSLDRTIKVWNIERRKGLFGLIYSLIHRRPILTLKGHSAPVNAVAVTPDGRWVISGSDDETRGVWDRWEIFGSDDETRGVWARRRTWSEFILTANPGSVDTVAITPDGKRVISGSRDHTIKVWNLETGALEFTLTGHSDSVRAVSVTPNGKRIISVSDDNTLKIWDLSTKKIIASFTGDGALTCCAVAPDGMTIVAGDLSGRVHFLRLEGIKQE